MSTIEIGGVPVGPDHQPFVIAEMSGNHNGDLERALDIVRAVAESGAQALKLQTYTADTMTLDLDLPAFRLPAEHELWSEARLYDLYKEAHTPWAWHEPIFELAKSLGMVAFSSAFDSTAIDFLEKLDVPAYKVASNEIGDLPLVRGHGRDREADHHLHRVGDAHRHRRRGPRRALDGQRADHRAVLYGELPGAT